MASRSDPLSALGAGLAPRSGYDDLPNSTQYRYDTLVLDGIPYGLNQTWTVNSTTWQDQVGLQYQLDEDTSGTPLHEWVDKVTLTMW